MYAESRAQVIGALREQVEFVSSLHLTLGGCTFEIRCNDTVLRTGLETYFGEFLKEPISESKSIVIEAIDSLAPVFENSFTIRTPEPGKTSLKEEWFDLSDGRVVRKIKTGMVMVFGGDDNLVIGPAKDNLNQVVNFVNNRFIEWKLHQGCLLGHAAAVWMNGLGVGMAGFSGMGKSTLALHLMNAGADFVSNDRLLIEETGEHLSMFGVAKWPRINPGTALHNPALKKMLTAEECKTFSAMDPEALWNLEQKYDVMIDQCFGPGRFRLNGPLDRLLLLNWKLGAGPLVAEEVVIAQRVDLLPAIMKSAGLFYLSENGFPASRSADEYQQMLSKCRVLTLSGGADFPAAVTAVKGWLDS